MIEHVSLIIEVDTAYDNTLALIEDLKVAIDEEEGVSLSIAGHRYEVSVVAMTKLEGESE